MMSIYELLGFSTDRRTEDIRWRSYTSSKRRADLFKKIPKIQFTDSGHGIVFCSRLLDPGERRKAENRYLADYVHEELTKLGAFNKSKPPSLQSQLLDRLQALELVCWAAWKELNEIRARDGVPWTHNGHRAGVSEEYFSRVVDALSEVLGNDAAPWPPSRHLQTPIAQKLFVKEKTS